MMRFLNGFCGFGRGFGGGFGGGGFGMLIVLIIVAIVIYALFRNKGSFRSIGNGSDHSLDILNERFARGEINEEEYKQKKALLLKH